MTIHTVDLSCRPVRAIKSCLRDPTREKSPSDQFDLKEVAFEDVQIREYPKILGDNPAVSEGAPLTIDWEVTNYYRLNINIYEITREPMRRKSRKKLLVSSKRRLQSLVESGYTLQELAETIVEVDKIRAMRYETARANGWNGPFEMLGGAMQTTGSFIRKAGRRGSKILKGSVMAAVAGMQALRLPPQRRRSITNPAC